MTELQTFKEACFKLREDHRKKPLQSCLVIFNKAADEYNAFKKAEGKKPRKQITEQEDIKT